MKTKRHFSWLLGLNLLALVAIVWLAYLLTRDIESTIATFQSSYLDARAKADVNYWREALAASAADRARLNSAFVGRESLISLIEELETVARQSGVDLTLAEPTIGQSTLTLTLTVAGSFPHIYHLLTRLENLPYELVFEKIDLRAGAGWRGEISLTLMSFHDEYVQN